MTIKIELTSLDFHGSGAWKLRLVNKFLMFLEDAPRQNTVVEDASSLVRVALRKALGVS
jgi:hypothetical protein